MSVTLTKAPEKISFSLNDMPVVITSNNYVAIEGQKSIVKLIFKAAVPNGQVINLVWSNASVTLTAAAAPDGSGKQFLSGNGNAAYVTALLTVFAANYYIDNDFDLTYELTGGLPSIIMTARSAGTLTNIVAVAGAIVEVSLATPGVAQILQPNIAVHLQLWLKSGNTFKKIIQNNLELDNPVTGVVTKDVAELLHPYLVPGYYNNNGTDRPALSNIAWQQCANTLLEFYFKYGEYYGATPEVKKLSTSEKYIVNIGQLDVANALGQTLAGYLRPGNVNNKTLCLRQGSTLKKIQLDQPEFLYWINLTGADTDIRLRIDLYYGDGDTNNFKVSPITALAWQKYYVGVGYNALNLNAKLLPGKSCAYYTACVVNAAGDKLSLTYTYEIDGYQAWPRYFIYRNSLGGFQTVCTWGKAQNETGITRDLVKKQVNQTQAAVSGNEAESNIRLRKRTTVNTGYISRRDVSNLIDFIASEEKYMVENGSYIPIAVTSDNLKEAMDGENLHAAQFIYTPLYDGTVFTDDQTAADNPNSSSGSAGGPKVYNVIVDNGSYDNIFIPEQ